VDARQTGFDLRRVIFGTSEQETKPTRGHPAHRARGERGHFAACALGSMTTISSRCAVRQTSLRCDLQSGGCPSLLLPENPSRGKLMRERMGNSPTAQKRDQPHITGKHEGV
ncbi:unnamed protein product, partial [Mycena citricolor]